MSVKQRRRECPDEAGRERWMERESKESLHGRGRKIRKWESETLNKHLCYDLQFDISAFSCKFGKLIRKKDQLSLW